MMANNHFNPFRVYVMSPLKKDLKNLHYHLFGPNYNCIRTRAYYYVNKLNLL